MTILGLDISTSITGWALVSSVDGSLKKFGSIELHNKKKFPTFFSKVKAVREVLSTIKFHYDPERVIIEPALSVFSKGKSSAQTISTLLKFNGIISYIVYDDLGIAPEYIPFSSARKIYGIKVPKGTKAKKCVTDFLLRTEPQFADAAEFTKKGNLVSKYYDIADAIVMARSGFLTNELKQHII